MPGLLASGAVLGVCACVEPDADPYASGDVPRPIEGVVELAIDGGGQIELEPGDGIGVAVEYAEGGQWSLRTACDTPLSGERCSYDILVSTDETAPITAFAGVSLEESDGVSALDEFAVAATFDTGDDTDGLGFTTSPGATVRVSALLYDPGPEYGSWFDWSDDPRFINWVGNGAVHRGAPTNPVDLTPDRP